MECAVTPMRHEHLLTTIPGAGDGRNRKHPMPMASTMGRGIFSVMTTTTVYLDTTLPQMTGEPNSTLIRSVQSTALVFATSLAGILAATMTANFSGLESCALGIIIKFKRLVRGIALLLQLSFCQSCACLSQNRN